MQKIAILYDASQAVLSTFELDEVLQQILIIARDYFHLPNVSILLLDKETNELYVRSQIGWDQKSDGVRVPIGTGLIGTAAKEKRPIYAIAQQTTAVLDAKELLSKVCMLIQNAFRVSHVSVLLKDDDDLVLRAHHGDLTPRIPEGGRLTASAGLWGRALETGKTLIE